MITYRTRCIATALLLGAVSVSGCAEHRSTSRHYSAIKPNARVEAPATKATRSTIEGRYAVNGAASDLVVITRIQGNEFRVVAPGFWDGVGFFDGKVYVGVFRYPADSKHGSLSKATGNHRATLQSDGSFKVIGSFRGDGARDFEVTWKKI